MQQPRQGIYHEPISSPYHPSNYQKIGDDLDEYADHEAEEA